MCPPLLLALSIACVLPDAATAPQGGNRHALETNSGAGTHALRDAMRSISAGLAVPLDSIEAIDPAAPTASWRLSARDAVAAHHFRAASRIDPAGYAATLGLAAATPDARIARRALAALLDLPPPVGREDNFVPVLLELAEHKDPFVATLAMSALFVVARLPLAPTTRQALVERALLHWSDDVQLEWPCAMSFDRGCDLWQTSRGEIGAKWIAIAAATGDRQVVDRLLHELRVEVSPGGPTVLPLREQGCGRARRWLMEVAPNVDGPTARLLHDAFAADFAQRRAGAAPTGDMLAALGILACIFARVPAELLPTYEIMLRDEDFLSRCRGACAVQGGVSDDRLRLLLLPWRRETDRDLLLRAPDLVVAALRSGPEDRQAMIATLSRPAHTPVAAATAAHWRTVLPAIEALPSTERLPLLRAIAPDLRRLDLDVAALLAGAVLQVAAQHITAALRVPVDPGAERLGWRSQSDEAAIGKFGEAARAGPEGCVAVLGAAASATESQIARRALAGVGNGGLGSDVDPDRVVPMLLDLADHRDGIVASLAADLLEGLAERRLLHAAAQQVVARALARWPADDLDLRWHSSWSPCPSAQVPFLCGAQRHIPSTLIALASGTGDTAVIDRLLQQRRTNDALPDRNDARAGAHAGFVRKCLERAAPYVSPEIARRIHGWFLPDFARWQPGLVRYDSAALGVDALARLFAVVPEDLVPSYEPMLRIDAFKLRVRRHAAECAAFPEARLRMLLLPLDREYDGNLVLHAPDVVNAALRGSDAERKGMIELLGHRVFLHGRPRIGPHFDTVAHWLAVSPALAELPLRERCMALEPRQRELSRLGIGLEWGMLEFPASR